MANPKIIPLILLLILFAGASASWSEDERTSSKIREIQRLKEEIYAINLINLLGLGADQIDLVLKRSDLARPLIETYEATLPEIYELQRRAYGEFKRENEADQGFDSQVEFFAAKASGLEKRLEEKMIHRLNGLAEPIYKVLTEAQKRILDEYDPFLFEEDVYRGLKAPSLQWRMDTIRELLEEAMMLSDGRFERERDKLARRIVNTLPRWSIGGGYGKARKGKEKEKKKKALPRADRFENRDDAFTRVSEALDELRSVPEDRRKDAIEHILKDRIFTSKMQQKQRELHEIHRSKHQQLSNAARFLLNPGAAAYLKDRKGKKRN